MGAGDLDEGKPHPMAQNAFNWIMESHTRRDLEMFLEAMYSCAIENNNVAAVCAETLRRVLNHEPVSDRYLLGLAWFLKERKENG